MTVPFEQLRYVRLGTENLAAATRFAVDVLGLQPAGDDQHSAYFRSDFRDHTLCFVKGAPTEQTVAFDVYKAADFTRAAEALAEAGYDVHHGDAPECHERRVKAFFSVRDSAGTTIEVVSRPWMTGIRYFPSRDVGITGLQGVALRSNDIRVDERLWTAIFNGKVSDWVGDTAYLRFDSAHHRIALHPSARTGILSVQYEVEGINQIMRAYYYLREKNIRIVHGPGSQPTSGQLFLTFEGPTGVLFSLVTGMHQISADAHRARQFPTTPASFDLWGGVSDAPEFGGHPLLPSYPEHGVSAR